MKSKLLFTGASILMAIGIMFVNGPVSAQSFSSITRLNDLSVTAITGEKPQSKVWSYAGKWWMVMPNSSGTQIWRLDGSAWTSVLTISGSTSTFADCKVVGSVTHILLYQGTSSSLVSVEYVPASNTYQPWSTRGSAVALTLDAGVETATIDIDGTGRMWLANTGTSSVYVRWSDSPYTTWSSGIELATDINDDDICSVISFGGNIGVLWSDQNSRRFGFRVHADGADPSVWSANEVPASQSALNIGGGMADDHLNIKAAADGTLYAAVKTSYNDGSSGNPQIAMLVRRPAGTWDNLYGIATSGTRPVVILNETAGKVKIMYTISDTGGDILYRESATSAISFGAVNTLMSGGTYNNTTSTKQGYSSDVVLLASGGGNMVSVLATDAVPGLAGHWKMNESTGAVTIQDASSNGNTAALTGNPAFTIGVEGNALSLNGTTQYASVPDNSSLDITSAITLAAWIAPGKSGTQRLIAKADMGTTDGYELSLSTDQQVFFRLNQYTGANTYRITSTLTYPVNGSTWMHVAATYDGTTMRLYLNGVLEVSGAGPVSINTNNNPLYIGREADETSPYYFQGSLDDVRLYNRALSLSEIQDLMIAPPAPPAPVSPANLSSNVALSPTLTWNTVPGAGSYQVQVSTTANFSNIIFDQVNILSTSVSVTPDLLNSTVYFWRVNATNAVGTGLWSSVWSFTTAGIPSVPPAPVPASPLNSAYSVPVSPVITWNASADASSYRVQVSLTPDFADQVFDQSSITATTVTVSPALSNNTLYYWRVNAANVAGTSIWSPVWTFTTIASTPAFETNGAGYALDFDGTNDYVNCGNNLSVQIAGTAITMEAWIKPTKVGTMAIIKKTGAIGGGTGYELYCGSAGFVYCRFNGLDGSRAWSTTAYPTNGTWIHVAATYDGISTKMYINGVLEMTTPFTANIVNSSNILEIANDPSTAARYFQGSIDEARLWNVARTQAEIQANMTKKLTGTETGLVGYWRFDETSGTVLNDETSYNNDGTLVNMDPATDHVWSGAALGNASSYDYLATGGYAASLNHTDGDEISAVTTSGTISGIQVYRADNSPVRTGSTGIPGYSLDPSRFWGVRAIGTATPTYTLVYNYTGNPAVTNESGLKLVRRSSVAVPAWTDALATLDTDANTLTVTGATGTEYALAISTASPPLAPGDLTASAASSFRVSLSWTDNSGDETNFEIERSVTGAGGTFTLLGTVGAGITTYNDTDVLPYSEYCYRVRAINGAGASDYSTVSCATTPQEGDFALQVNPNTYVSFGAAPSLATNNFTVETWFRRTGTGTSNTTGTSGIAAFIPILTKGSPESDATTVDENYVLGINAAGNYLAADFEEGTGSASPGLNHPLTGTTVILDNQWYHAAATFTNGVFSIYLNGVLENSVNLGTAVWPQGASIQHSALGTMLTSTGTPNGYFAGQIDEARVWNYARSESEIRSSINEQITAQRSGLLARWSLNEGAGTIVSGTAGTTVNGSITGSAYAWITPGAPFDLSFTPEISITGTPLTPFSSQAGVASPDQIYSVSGSNLSGDILIQAPTGFEISTTAGSGYSSSVTLSHSSGAVPATSIYVHFISPSFGTFTGDITHSSTGAQTINVAVSGTAVNQASLSFQQGVSGYAGTVDTHLQWYEPSAAHGDMDYFKWDTQSDGGPMFGLIRFDNIFGSGVGQIPVNSVIESATLTYTSFDTGDPANIYEVAVAVWDESATYDNFGTAAGVQAEDYGDFVTAAPGNPNGVYQVDVSSSLRKWVTDPGSNRGWIFYPTNTDGVQVRSSEYVTISSRPLLTVTYLIDPPDQPVLISPADNSSGQSTSPTLSVRVTDPESRPMTVSYYGRRTSSEGDNFTVIGLPDTQYYTDGTNGGSATMFTDQTLWIRNNQATENIAFVSHVGDVTDDNTDEQWQIANTAMSSLDAGANIPFGISLGNHDQLGGTTALYNSYFGISRFSGRSYYGGHYGSDNDNNYEFFSAGNMDFIVIHIKMDAPSEVLAWADQVLKAYPERRAIVTSHSIINAGNPGTFTPNGTAIYNALRGNPNLFLMLCGHVPGTGRRSDTYNGNTVHTLLADYQSETGGGSGYLRIMEFSPQNNQIEVRTYSPYLDASKTDAGNLFQLPYNMSGEFELIGTDYNVTSGTTSEMVWPDLAGTSEYDWYVTVSNGENIITGPVWSFSTLDPSMWTGAADSDWNNYLNWQSGSVPTTGEVVIGNVENDPVVNDPASCDNLIIRTGGSLTIMPDATLSVSGSILTGGNLTIESDATSSGSLFVSGTSGNNVVYNRYMRNDDRHFFSSPVGGSIPQFESTHSVEVYEWDEILGIWDPDVSETEFLRGKGYAWDQDAPAPRTVAFIGSTVNSAGPIICTAPYAVPYNQDRTPWGGGGWNLLGNPFTTALNATEFIEANSASFDLSYMALYVYDGPNLQYKWAGYTAPGYPLSGSFGQYVQAGQGFFVLAANNDVPFSFSQGMRAYAPGVLMMKSVSTNNPWPGLQLKVSYGENTRTTNIVYNSEMTAGLDPGYDIGQLSAGSDVEIYTLLADGENDVSYAQQALPLTDFNRNIIQVGIDSENGGELTFSAFAIPFGDYRYWLEDRKTGKFTDLTTDSYKATIPARTYGSGRFFIYTSVNMPTSVEDVTTGSDLRIWASKGKIIIKGAVSSDAICRLYDLKGAEILNIRLSDTELNTVDIPSGIVGAFLVRVTDGAEVVTRKILIL